MHRAAIEHVMADDIGFNESAVDQSECCSTIMTRSNIFDSYT